MHTTTNLQYKERKANICLRYSVYDEDVTYFQFIRSNAKQKLFD